MTFSMGSVKKGLPFFGSKKIYSLFEYF